MAEIIITEYTGTTPSPPPSGKWKLYFKSDGAYILDDTGAETKLGGGITATVWGMIAGTLSNQTDLQTALDAKYPSADHTKAAHDALGIDADTLDGSHASAFAGATHAAQHKSGGADAIKLDELSAPTDNTTLNASTTAHGLLPKLSGVATQYLDGTGAWSTPAGGGGSGSATLTNKSGASVSAGDVVVFDPSNDSAFKTTIYPFDMRVCGVANATIADNASGQIVTGAGSVATVNCDSAAVERGQFLTTSTTAGKASSAGYFRSPGVFAIALTAKAGGAAGAVSAMLIDNFRQAIAGNLGYALGGYNGSASINTGQRFVVSTATWTTVSSAALSVARNAVGSLTYTTNGVYAIGGYAGSYSAVADYMPFATETTAAQTSANLGQARYQLRGSASASSSGYICGGGTSSALATTDKITFATGQRSAGSNLSSARNFQNTVSDGVYGYVRGSVAATADKITFSTDTIAAHSPANLDAADSNYSAFSYPATAGYNAYKSGATAKCRKINFATGSDAAVTSTPPSDTAYASAVGDGLSAHWIAGSATSPYTQACKFDAATETWSADSGASLAAASYQAAQGSYGAW